MTTKFFLTLMSHASFCLLYAHSLECTIKGIRKAMAQCLDGTGFSRMDPSVIITSDPRYLCRNISMAKEAIGCTARIAKECAQEDFKGHVTGPATIQSAIQSLCENLTAINSSCKESAALDVTDCYVRKRGEAVLASVLEEVCHFFQAMPECMADLLPRCGCNTANIYLKILKQMNPPPCNPVKLRIPGCKPWPDASGNLQRMSLLPWVALVLYSLRISLSLIV